VRKHSFAISTSPIIHLVCPPPAAPKVLHNLSFPFLLGITVVPRETEDNAYAKLWGEGGGGGKEDTVFRGVCGSGQKDIIFEENFKNFPLFFI